MENAVIDKETTEVSEPTPPEPANSQWIIRRPKRKVVTEEEAVKWMEDFASQRKEQFIAAIRKSKG